MSSATQLVHTHNFNVMSFKVIQIWYGFLFSMVYFLLSFYSFIEFLSLLLGHTLLDVNISSSEKWIDIGTEKIKILCFKASLKFKADESGICKPRNRVSKLKITLLVFSESQPSVFWLCFADKNFQRVLSTLPNNACFINKLNSSLQRPRADLELPCSYITAMEC